MTGKILFVIAHNGYQPVEYAEPKKILHDAGFHVVTASDKPGSAKDKDGNITKVDLTLKDVNVNAYDGIFFIGGPGALECLDNEESYRIIKRAAEKHLPLGAICISTRILAKAGALTRHRATGWNGDNELEKIYAEYDVKYLPEPVVVEENIITAIGPTAAKTFGQEIISLLQNNKGWG
ncbi:MAG: ThiJ/PfpI [uncultured bacterium]|nr:MAG: ThiJ/PfpI [uncultured bacterium]